METFKRRGYVREILPIAIQRIKQDKCPVCELPKSQWKRTKRWKTCSTECTSIFWTDRKFTFVGDWQATRAKVAARDNWTCVRCKKPFHEVDHIIPVAVGGDEFDIENCQCLCYGCHKKKTVIDIKEIAKFRRIVKLQKHNEKLYT